MGITKNISGWFIGAGIGVLLIIVSVSAIITTGTWWVDSINELSLAGPKIEYPNYKEVESVNYTIEYSKEKLVLSNADETITLTRVK